MPEAALAEAPAQDQALPTAASKDSKPSMLESLVGQFDDPAETTAKPGKETKPDATKPPAADKAAAEKPEAPAGKTDKKADAGKPAPKLYEAHEALKKKVASEYEPELQRLRKEVETFKAQPKSDVDPKAYESAQKEIERLSGLLREASYERSPEYKQKFLDRRDAIYKDAVETVAGLSVIEKKQNPETGEIEASERPATEQDFRKIFFLPARDQDRALADMFGPSGPRVAQFISELQRNDRDAQLAIQQSRDQAGAREREAGEKTKAEMKLFNDTLNGSMKELQEKWPQWFAVPPADGEKGDKELAESHQGGYDFVDNYVAKAPSLSVEDRAAHAAVIRARAAAFPRLVTELRRVRQELGGYKSRIKDKEKSDPGSGGEQHAGPDTKTDTSEVPKGIEAAAAQFDVV